MFWGFSFEHNLRYPKITKDVMVYSGFHDAWRDITDPPPAQSAPDPHDEENMDGRPDQEEMDSDESTNSCRGWRSKRRRASRTWPPYCHTCPRLHKGQGSTRSMSAQDCTRVKGPLAPCLWPRLWRLVFFQHWTKIRPIGSPRQSCCCTDTLTVRTTGYYTGISCVILVYLVVSLAYQLDNSCPVEARE